MLNAQQRARLRSLSNNLRDLVYLGKEGLTDNVITQIKDNLYAHELIKIKAQKNIPEPIEQLANNITVACNCEVVAIIGSKILVYKYTDKPKFAHLL